MQAKAPRLRPASGEEVRVMSSFASSIGTSLESVAANPYVLEIPGASYRDVFDLPELLVRVIESFGPLYSAGYYVGSIVGSYFSPGLPLSQRLARLCSLGVKCIVLDNRGARAFLYGQQVSEEHVLRFSEGISVVVDSQGEALGWGVGKKVRLKTKAQALVEPVKDLGWYLRRGG